MTFTILHLFFLFPFTLSSKQASSESVQSVESFERALEGLKSSDGRLMGSVSAGEEHVHPVRDIVENRKSVLSNVERGRHLHRAGAATLTASSNALRMNST